MADPWTCLPVWMRDLTAYIQRRRLAPWLAAVHEVCERPCTTPHDLPCQIMPHLLLSSKTEASKLGLLQAFGVTHVLNAAGRVGRAPIDYAAEGIAYLELRGEDEEGYPMLQNHFSAASAFVQAAAAAGGRCLVHCVAGINRSGVLAAATLMVSERLAVLEAVQRCKGARGLILVNESFQLQLVALAEERGLLGPLPQGGAKLPPPKKPRKPAGEAFAQLVR